MDLKNRTFGYKVKTGIRAGSRPHGGHHHDSDTWDMAHGDPDRHGPPFSGHDDRPENTD